MHVKRTATQALVLPVLVAATWLLAACAGSPTGSPQAAECPQPRFTDKAPPEFLAMTNPLPADSRAVLAAGERSYLGRDSKSIGCAACHGEQGDGLGPLAGQFNPRPRNFACAATVNGIPDGQLFWIIRYGSPGTAMPAHPQFSDAQTWQVVSYLRRLAR